MISTALLSLTLLSAQLTAQPAFAVASIKPSETAENGYVRWFPGGRLRVEHLRLHFLIRLALTCDRFHMATHCESRELPVYILTLDKTGSRLRTSAPDHVQRLDLTSECVLRRFTVAAAPSSSIARNLPAQLKQTVVDRTGLKGEFDGAAEWSGDFTDLDSGGPSLFTALNAGRAAGHRQRARCYGQAQRFHQSIGI